MERVSINSFIKNGHPYHLYTYGPVENIPAGCTVIDGNEIVPSTRIKDFKYLAQFSNLFVYKLLLDKGGWFSDCDNVCLRPLDFPEPYFFYRDRDETTVTAALCKCPKGAPIMQYLYDTVNDLTPEQLSTCSYQALGPDLTRKLLMPQWVYGFGMQPEPNKQFTPLQKNFKPGITSDPIQFTRVCQIVDPEVKWDLSQSYSLHLFSGAWKDMPEHEARGDYRALGSKDAAYPDGCLYEQLKKRYL
jgi:hypothetical protein